MTADHALEISDRRSRVADDAEERVVREVVEHAQPGILKVVRYKLAFQGQWESQDIEDVAGDVVLELIGRLRRLIPGCLPPTYIRNQKLAMHF